MKKLIIAIIALTSITYSLSGFAQGKSLGDVADEITGSMKGPEDADAQETKKLFETCGTDPWRFMEGDPKKVQCLRDGLVQLGNKGNYFAQASMAYELLQDKNKTEASKWNKMALENPKTPPEMKEKFKEQQQKIDALP